LKQYLESIIQIAKQAGDEIAKIYYQQNLITEKKADASFVTEADIKAHHLIVAGLNRLTPEIPVISEEIAIPSFAERQHWQQYWSVDPLDGTYEFVHKKGEFVVSIALIENHYPIFGIIQVPLKNLVYFAAREFGSYKIYPDGTQEKISSQPRKKTEPIRVVVSRRARNLARLTEFLAQFEAYELIECSSALKFCLVAEGTADIYPRFGDTSEWDIAAGQCIIEQTGGKVVDLTGNRLSYNTKESLKNPHFLAIRDPNFCEGVK